MVHTPLFVQFLAIIWQVTVMLVIAGLAIALVLIVRRSIVAKREERLAAAAKIFRQMLMAAVSEGEPLSIAHLRLSVRERARAFDELSQILDSEQQQHLQTVGEQLALRAHFLRRLQSWRPDDRATAVRLAGIFEGEDVHRALAARLHDRASVVRVAAFQAIVRTQGFKDAQPLLLVLADREVHDEVKRQMIIDVARRQPAIVATLLARTADPRWRLSCVEALAEAGDPSHLSEIEKLAVEPDAALRLQLATVLRRLARPSLMQPVESLLRDPEAAVRTAAVEAAAAISPRRFDADLKRLLLDGSATVRGAASRALGVGPRHVAAGAA